MRSDLLFRSINPRFQHLIIMPTEKCNFRCVYCYEDFKIGRMKRATIDSIRAFISTRSSDIDSLSISWFGGEPLLAEDIVVEISQHAKSLNESFHGSITTNGFLLTNQRLRRLLDSGVNSFQITIDGSTEVHDLTRVTVKGDATFATIWQNLISMRDIDAPLEVVIRLHIHDQNYNDIRGMVSKIQEELCVDPRFKIHLKPIENLGGRNGVEAVKLNSGKFRTIFSQIRSEVEKSNLLDFEEYVCYASRPNSLVIRADGRIGKCTVALNDDRNTIGSIETGGRLQIDDAKTRLWFHGFESQSDDDLACPLKNLPSLPSPSINSSKGGKHAEYAAREN